MSEPRLVLAVLLLLVPAFAGAEQGLRDPMQPPAAVLAGEDGKSAALPSLSMVLIRDGKARALIDGSLRAQGEHFAGWRVARIEPGYVLLDGDDGQRVRITLLGESGQGIHTETRP